MTPAAKQGDRVPPLYQRVIDAIKDDVESGRLKPGDRIPSIAELAKRYDVSQGTVKTALLVLRQSGVVVGVQGRATYVAHPGEPGEAGGVAGAAPEDHPKE